jgi:hypothetical protein
MQTLTVVYFSLPSLTLTSFISHFHNTCSVDHKYYWEIVVLLRKLCIGIIVSFFTVEPLVAIPLQFLIIFVSICMQLRWGPYISVKNRCGVCGSGRWRNISVRCCRGANNRIELILMSAECLLLVAGFANAAVGGTSVVGAGAGAAAGMTNRTDVLQRARALSGTGSGLRTPEEPRKIKETNAIYCIKTYMFKIYIFALVDVQMYLYFNHYLYFNTFVCERSRGDGAWACMAHALQCLCDGRACCPPRALQLVICRS